MNKLPYSQARAAPLICITDHLILSNEELVFSVGTLALNNIVSVRLLIIILSNTLYLTTHGPENVFVKYQGFFVSGCKLRIQESVNSRGSNDYSVTAHPLSVSLSVNTSS